MGLGMQYADGPIVVSCLICSIAQPRVLEDRELDDSERGLGVLASPIFITDGGHLSRHLHRDGLPRNKLLQAGDTPAHRCLSERFLDHDPWLPFNPRWVSCG
jgi:hypothetical protein